MLKFQLVVPAFNEEKNLGLIIDRFIKAAQAHKYLPEDVQLVLVNNGSTDHSAETLKLISDEAVRRPWLKVVNVEKNQGYGFGVLCGLLETSAKVIGWSHADMQCDPEDAFKAFYILKQRDPTEKWLVKGVRHDRNPKDIFVSRFFEALASFMLGYQFHEINAQPKVFDRQLLHHLKNPPHDFSFDLYVLLKAYREGYAVATLPVRFPARIHGVSSWANHFLSRYKTILKMVYSIWLFRGREY